MNFKLCVLVAASVIVFGTASTASAQFAKVAEAKVTVPADQLNYRGQCPVEVKLGGIIRTEGPGAVKFQFVYASRGPGLVQQFVSLRAGETVVHQIPKLIMRADEPAWNESVILRILSNPGGNFDSPEVKYGGMCQQLKAVAPTATQSTAFQPAQARFRVTLNGFTCNKESGDASSLLDGSGDEVYMLTKTFDVDMNAAGTKVGQTRMNTTRTSEYGDVAVNFPQRIQAGSSRAQGSKGGIVTGDSYPESPEKLSADPQRQALPQMVWEGNIARFKNAVVIMPTIWESDGSTDGLYGRWQRRDLEKSLSSVIELIRDPSRTDPTLAISAIRKEVSQQTRLEQPLGDIPIGMREILKGYQLRAEVLILTYDEAQRIAQLNKTTGQAFALTYDSAPALGGGNYTLWLQVEQIP